MPRFSGHAPLILRVSNGVSDHHHVVPDVRSAVKSAQAFAEAGYDVCLLGPGGQVVMTLSRQGRRPA